MKKFFSLITAVLLAGSIMAADEVYKQTIFNATNNSKGVQTYTDSWSNTTGGFTTEIDNGNNNNNGWDAVKFGRKNNASVGTIITSAAIDKAISKVDITIDALTASKINSIKLYTSTNKSTWSEVGSYTKAAGAQSVPVATPTANLYYKLEFDCASGSSNGLITISKVEYYKAEEVAPGTVATPTFTPVAGTYLGTQNVTINCATEGATIYYTTNGDAPTTSSTAYTAAIPVSANTTIKAIAAKADMTNSAVATAAYTIISVEHAGTAEDPYSVADAYIAIDNGVGLTNVYAKGIVSEIVDEYSSSFGNISYNISVDGEKTSPQLQAFRGKANNGEKFTSADDVRVGDEVVVYGSLTKYNSTYEFAQDNQLKQYIARTPEFSIGNVEYLAVGAADLALSDLTIEKEGEGTITLVSGDENVATIVENKIHAVDAGDVTITANIAANGYWRAHSTTFKVHVIVPCLKNVTLSKGTPEHGTFTLNKEAGEYPTCEAAFTVIVTPSPAEHYHVDEIIAPNSASVSEPDGEGKYTITYAQNTNAVSEINVKFEENTKYTVTWDVNGNTDITTQVYVGEKPVFPANPESCDATSTAFYGWASTAWAGKIASVADKIVYITADAMPAVAENVTYFAVFAKATPNYETKTYGFENEESDEEYWIINGPNKDDTYKSSGTYAGKINTNNSYVTFKNKVNVTNFSFAFTRTSNNANYNVYIETSEDNNTWTSVETYPMGDFNNDGTFKTCSKDFDGKTELYIRFRCYNTTAVRYVDDFSITYGSMDYSAYITTCDDTPSAISNTAAEGKAVKSIVNGQLVITRDGHIYNALGVKLN